MDIAYTYDRVRNLILFTFFQLADKKTNESCWFWKFVVVVCRAKPEHGSTLRTTRRTTRSTTSPDSLTQVRWLFSFLFIPKLCADFSTWWRGISPVEGFTSHQAVARTAGNVLLRLADAILLPFKCSDYAETLEQYLGVAEGNFEAELKANGISMGTSLKHSLGVTLTDLFKISLLFLLALEPLKGVVKSFRSAAASLEQTISSLDVMSSS